MSLVVKGKPLPAMGAAAQALKFPAFSYHPPMIQKKLSSGGASVGFTSFM
jgi:hypothetical protein